MASPIGAKQRVSHRGSVGRRIQPRQTAYGFVCVHAIGLYHPIPGPESFAGTLCNRKLCSTLAAKALQTSGEDPLSNGGDSPRKNIMRGIVAAATYNWAQFRCAPP